MARKKNHVHKYGRVRLGKQKDYVVYKCFLDCPHYLVPELVIGRRSICWACGEAFTMTKMTLKLKPTCGCQKPNEDKDEEFESEDILARLGIS